MLIFNPFKSVYPAYVKHLLEACLPMGKRSSTLLIVITVVVVAAVVLLYIFYLSFTYISTVLFMEFICSVLILYGILKYHLNMLYIRVSYV